MQCEKNLNWVQRNPSVSSSLLRTLVLQVLLLLSSLPLSAQKLTVESMELLPNDATASVFDNQRKDLNGNYAGVVKVMLAVNGATFEGGGVLEQRLHRTGEYWVWLAKDSKRIKIYVPGYLPLELNFFNDYKIKVESKRTYKLVLTAPSSGQAQQDDGMSYLAMTVEPANANVFVDGNPQTLFNGQLSALVSNGSHNYEVSAIGYLPQKGTVSVVDNMEPLVIRLESIQSTQSSLRLSCATDGAQLYINNQSYGTLPQTVSLFPGSYRIEVRLDGYRSYREDITLEARSDKEWHIPSLERATGVLRVNYMPLGGEVYVDDTKLGTSPGTFRNVSIGSHKVEIRKDGYITLTQTVTIEENKPLELSGNMTAMSSQESLNSNAHGSEETVEGDTMRKKTLKNTAHVVSVAKPELVLTEGLHYIKNVATGLLLSFGGNWGTQAVVDDRGLGFFLKKSSDGISWNLVSCFTT